MSSGIAGRRSRGIASLIASLAALGVAIFAAPTPADATATATPAKVRAVAETGFDPSRDGYAFANYGGGYADLDPAAMERMFGPRVCARGSGAGCVPTPVAASLMEQLNRSMADGHCMGFAFTAQAFFEGLRSPEPFGSAIVHDLVLDGNVPLQRRIAEGWTTQVFPSVRDAAVKGRPSKVLKRLRRALAADKDPYVLTIAQEGAGGHAITPTAVVRTAPKHFRVKVYDNNWPGQTRAVLVNTRKERWRYNLGGGLGVWKGNRRTKTLELLPVKPGLGRQPCFSCDESGAVGRSARGTGDVFLAWEGNVRPRAHGDLLVRDRAGREAGCRGARCFNRIPGAELWEQLLGAAPIGRRDPHPFFRLPGRGTYRATLSGSGLSRPAEESLALFGPGWSLSADGIELRRGERDRVRFSSSGRRIVFANDHRGTESPDLELTTSTADASYRFEVKARGVDPRSKIAFRLRKGRQLLLIDASDASGRGRFEVELTRLDGDGEDSLSRSFALGAGESRAIAYGELE